jgi:hypothetical protein
MQEVVVVLQPLRQDMKWDDPPATLPHLKTKGFKATMNVLFISALLFSLCMKLDRAAMGAVPESRINELAS